MPIHHELSERLAASFAELSGSVAAEMAQASARATETFDRTLDRIDKQIDWLTEFEATQCGLIATRADEDIAHVKALVAAKIKVLQDSQQELAADRAMFAEPAPDAPEHAHAPTAPQQVKEAAE